MITSVRIEKSLGQVMVYGFISVLISSLSICTWCFLVFCWVYDCLFLVCFVEWFCILVSEWNKYGFLVCCWWYQCMLRAVYFREYEQKHSNCLPANGDKELSFILFLLYEFGSAYGRQIWEISLITTWWVCLVSSHQAYSNFWRLQRECFWIYVFNWVGNKKQEWQLLCLFEIRVEYVYTMIFSFERDLGFRAAYFGLSTTSTEHEDSTNVLIFVGWNIYNKDLLCVRTGLEMFLGKETTPGFFISGSLYYGCRSLIFI